MRMSVSRLFAGMVPMLALALSACSGGGGSDSNPSHVDTTPPTVPTGVAATPQSPTEIQVQWSASIDTGGAGLSGYRVYRDGGATPVATVNAATTSFIDSALTASTSYSYTVRSFDAALPPNESALSASVSATTPPMPVIDITAPTVPTNLVATALSPTQVRLTWTASTDTQTGVAGYRVFRNGGGTAIATVNAGTTYTDSGLTANTVYTYALVAFDAATPENVSALTPAANVTTPALPDITPPTTPTGLTATALSSSQIRLSWNLSTDTESGVSGYLVFQSGVIGAIATPVAPPYVVNLLLPGTAYTFTVRAIDRATPANQSAASVPATATTQAAPDVTAPTLPTNVTATALSDTQIRITWSPSTDTESGVGGYRIFRNGSATVLADVTTTSFTDSGLTASTLYSYRVRAYDQATPAVNVSALSVAASATTQAGPDVTAPTVPANVTATALSSSQIQISWTASTDTESGVGGYHIFRNGSATLLATVPTASYTDTGLTASTAYNYKVSAFDLATPANESAQSTMAAATTQAAGTPTSGLDARPSNTTCVAGAVPSQSAAYTYQQVYNNVALDAPVALIQAPGDNSRWFVLQQGGIVKKFNNVASPPAATNFVNLTSKVTYSGERGLLGMAFHPSFPTDPRVYVYYTTNAVDRLSEFRTTDGGLTLDPNSENVLFNVTDPEENHNGGNVAFGPDGYLYIGIGDGGGGDDQHSSPTGNGQRLTILMGKMLRIDVGPFNLTPQPYTIPAANPFFGNTRCNTTGTGTGSCPEIFAYGFRNPWRWSFDRGTGDLWVGDVGESDWEEINKVTVGGNYGWRCREGAHSHLSCGTTGPYIDPIVEIAHPAAGSITGGYVYRGSAIPGLNGRYVFGDFSSGWLWDISRTTTPTVELGAGDGVGTPASMSTFGEDLAGELYFVNYFDGNIYKIVPSGGGGGGTVASLLSQTGCANAANPKLPSSGMIPYAPNAPFWSDGAVKNRWLALPNGDNINIDAADDFDFPEGSVLRKDFTLGATLVETRLFMRHTGGTWAGYTYRWNALGTEATRVIGGLTTTVNGQTWEFPSESACLVCHTSAAGRTLGLEVGQLNGDLLYPSTGRTANQLYTLNFIDTLRPVITLPTDQLAVIPNPFGTAGTETDRARAWLHTNCANCHRPGGGTPVNIDLRYTTTLLGTSTCNVMPTSGDLGIANARLIAPGSAATSLVLARVNRVGTDAMPPLARHYIDTQGVALLTSWINSLSSCN